MHSAQSATENTLPSSRASNQEVISRVVSVQPDGHSTTKANSRAPATLTEQHSRSTRAPIIGLVGKAATKRENTVTTEEELGANATQIFGFKAKAYWGDMGAWPLGFSAFGILVLAIKLAKVKTGTWTPGGGSSKKGSSHASIVTSIEQEAELHVFKCGGCGYEMYPARGREFKFFPDSFKCPLCQSPKSAFWDLNDPTDPRNQENDDEEADLVDEGEDTTSGKGPSSETQARTVDPSDGSSKA